MKYLSRMNHKITCVVNQQDREHGDLYTTGASIGSAIRQRYAEDESAQFPITLDDFYHHSLSESTDRGAENQVLFRHQGLGACNVPGKERLVCMVDQLWLHIVDKGRDRFYKTEHGLPKGLTNILVDTVLTSCSRNWDSEACGPTIDVQEVLRRHLLDGKDTRPPLLSPYGMVPLAIAACIRESIDLNLPQAGERLLDVFRVAIARAVSTVICWRLITSYLSVDTLQSDKEAGLFKVFNESLGPNRHDDTFTQKCRDGEIKGAVELLREIKDDLDELNIIKTVLSSQNSVLTDAFSFLTRICQPESDYIDFRRGRKLFLRDDELESILELTDHYRTYSKLDLTILEVDKLISDAIQVRDNVRSKHHNEVHKD